MKPTTTIVTIGRFQNLQTYEHIRHKITVDITQGHAALGELPVEKANSDAKDRWEH